MDATQGDCFALHIPVRELPEGRTRCMNLEKGLSPCRLDDIPHVLYGIAKFSARDARAKAVIANANCVVLKGICEIIFALGHSSHKDADALLGSYICYIVFDPNDIRVETKCDLSATRREMVGDRILDHLE